jgi:hypothetical protein
MRTTDPTLLAPFLHGFSETQRQIVQNLVDSEVSDAQLERMKLPINQGGFDLGFQEITSCAAYVSSLVGVQHTLRTIPGIDLEEQSIPLLMRMGECVEAMQEVIPNINKQTIWAETAPSGQTLQSKFTGHMIAPKHAQILQAILDSGDTHGYVSLSSATNLTAGAFIRTIPKTQLLSMSNLETTVALCNRFHMTQRISPAVRCDCSYNGLLDSRGVHLSICSRGGGHQTTHDNLNNFIASISSQSGFRNKVEERLMFDGTGKRPDISFAPGTLDPKPVLVDVTVTHPLSGRNNPNCNGQAPATLAKSGWAAQNAAQGKNRKYTDACNRIDSKFIALVFESSGYMHPDLLLLLKTISEHAAETRKIPAHILYRYYINTLSVILHRSVAAAMIRRSMWVMAGASVLPVQRHMMSYDNIMLHERAYVDRG